MIALISWRNIWRNKLRSFMVIIAIALGIWSVSYVMAFINSVGAGIVNSAIENHISHIQIHHKNFKEDMLINLVVPKGAERLNQLASVDNVQSVSSRIIIGQGMLKTAKGNRGVVIKGIIPELESKVTNMDTKLDTGSYFEKAGRNPIVIGRSLAEKMNLKLRSSVVLTFLNTESETVSAKFRVRGIYSTGSSMEDRMNVFVRQADIARILGMTSEIHELAIVVNDLKQLPATIDEIKNVYPDAIVESYKDVAPLIELMEGQIKINMSVILGIILAAMGFGIINTMLMAVLERMRELGMLMAIGMNKTKIFMMIVFETVMLALIGGPLGLLLGFVSISYSNKVGVDLSIFSSALEQFGIDTIVRPYLEGELYVTTIIAVVLTALASSIYPAIKALKLNPAESIQSA
ncbi:MAG: ABC transporter permease [Flavobacteriales bacterium]|nr:ABC transporter permease [Flavobacteriales bacterium]